MPFLTPLTSFEEPTGHKQKNPAGFWVTTPCRLIEACCDCQPLGTTCQTPLLPWNCRSLVWGKGWKTCFSISNFTKTHLLFASSLSSSWTTQTALFCCHTRLSVSFKLCVSCCFCQGLCMARSLIHSSLYSNVTSSEKPYFCPPYPK